MAGVQCVGVCAVFASSVLQFLKYARTSLASLSILIPGLVFAQAQMATPGSFAVSPGGAANYTIPIQISPGTGGMQPNLALGYSSQGSNGSLGVGWTLAGLSVIHRCAQTIVHDGVPGGINHDANDRFCVDGQRLIVVNGLADGANNAEYRTERETFNRIYSFGVCGSGPCWWRIESRSGQIMQYGNTPNSAMEPAGVGQGGLVMLWALNMVYDRVGNYMTITYSEDNANGEMHPTQIDYTGNGSAVPAVAPYNSVVFDYEARTDILGSEFIAGAPTRVTTRLKTIRANNGATEVRRYALGYDTAQTTSLLKSVTECVGATCLPATTFDWQLSTGATQWAPTATNWGSNLGNLKNFLADFNGDGIKDLLTVEKYTFGLSQIGYRTWVSYSSGYGFTAPVNIGANPDVTVGDVNGDGKADVISGGGIQFSNGSGFTAATPLGVTLPGPQSGGISSDLYIFSGDVSGDGKDDLITSQTNCDIRGTCSSNWHWALSNGSAFANLTVGGGVAVSSVGDVHGDGRADILVGNTILKSTGAGFLAAVVWSSSALSGARYLVDADGDGRQDLMTDNTFCNGYGSCSTSHALSSSNGASFGAPAGLGSELCGLGACLFGDVTGDGAPDLVRVGGGLATVRPMQRRTPHFLIRVTDGLNAVTEITYKPISDTTVYTPSSGSIYPIRDILPQSALNVVASSRSSDGLGGLYTLRYTYTGAKTHQQGGGLLGFASMVTYDDQKGTYAQTIFRQDWPYHGLPTQTYQRLYSGATLSATVNTWNANNTYARVYYPYVSQSVANAYELNQTPISQITTNAVVNSYGNTTRVEIISSDGYTKTNINTYSDNVASWILGRVTCSAVTNTLPNATSATRTSSFAYRADGLLNREVVEPGIGCVGAPAASTDAKLRVTTDYVYDAFGNKQSATTTSAVASTDSAYFAPRTSYTYFEAQGANPAGRFPTRVVNALGHTETHEFDARFGAMTKLTGPNNVVTSWAYDVLGRKASESRADGTVSTWTYNYYSGSWIVPAYSISTTSTGSPSADTYFDRLNRQVRSYVTYFDGTKSIGGGVDYNSLGQVLNRYRNFFSNATSFPATSFTYDAIGRVNTQTAADGSQATFTYSGFTTSVTRTTGRGTPSTITSTSVVNSQGQKLSITDAAGTITSYTYDPFGNLLTTNAGGVVTSMAYNLRGFKTSMNDPDMGVWSYQYSALGELKQQTDAKLQVTTMTYDLLGRLTNRSEPSLISNWYYDAYKGGGVCAGGKGKLCQVESSNGYNRTYTYDTLGRGTEVAYTIDDVANPYRITTTYGVVGDTVCPNSQGKVCTVTYPAATVSGVTSRFAVRNEYNAVGYLAKIWRKDVILTKPYWTGTAMNADGNFTGDSMGASAADLTTVRDFDPLTGRLKAIKSGLASATAAQFNRYVYDHLGNVTERHDDNMNVHETFTLDALSRLTQMSMTGTTAQTKTYQYNAIGNLTYKSDLGTLTYPAIGSPRPHGVTSIAGNATGVLDGVTNGAYVYDANGNMSYSVVVDRIFTYTSFNLPSRIDNQNSLSDFIYDADHNRISESYVNGTIIYVNPGNVTFFERHKNFNQAGYEIYRFFVHTPSGATIFFSRQSNNGAQAVRFQLKDNLGSTVADVDATGNVVTRYSFDAFGKVRNPNGSATGGTISESRRGFTGHEHIKVGNSGLIHMNGRVYDATLGRFTTADPMIQAPSFSQSYNRYTYGFNNPLSGTDPSGFDFWSNLTDFASAHDDFVRNPFKIENLFALNHNIPGHGTIDHFMMTHEWARVAGRAAATFFAGWFGPWAAAGANAMITGYEVWLAGGSSQDIHKASAISFATGMAFSFVGDGAAAIAKGGNVGGAIAFKIVGHAAVGCASASAGGGDCGEGALSAGFGAAASVATANLGLSQPAHFVVTVVAGGVGAKLGGGKFVNGASTAAMGYLMNWIMHINGKYYGGDVTREEANQHYRTCVTNCDVYVEASNVKFFPHFSAPGRGQVAKWIALPYDSFSVYGNLNVIGTGNPGEYVIPQDAYNFEMHTAGSISGWVPTAVRNFETWMGDPGPGKPFLFIFTGTANVK